MAPKAAPKVKKAMNKPPAEATRSHDAFPGEHLGAKPSPSRKRAADFYEDDDVETEPKSPDTKATKAKKPKTAAATDHTKPSKVDGHPVETDKTHPGGDMVEVEPRKRGRPSKKDKDKGNSKATPGSAAPAKGPKAKSSKVPDAAKESAEQDLPVGIDDGDVNAEAAAAPKPKKTKKGAPKGDEADQNAKPENKATKPKKAAPKAKDSGPKSAEKSATPKSAAKPTKQKNVTESGSEAAEKPEAGEDEQASQPAQQEKGKKSKGSAKKDESKEQDSDVAPDLAMDGSAFDSLLSTDKGKEPVDEGPTSKGKSKSGKALQKAKQDQSKDDTKASKKGKAIDKVANDKEGPTPKSKKRKLATGGDVDAVKADVLDPLNEAVSAKKRQKKTGPSALEAAGDSLGSLLSSVQKNVKAGIDYVGNVASGGQTSIMHDVEGVAEGVVSEKQKKKGAKKAENEIPSEESLLKGMESSGDDKDPDEDEGFDQGQLPPPLPESTFEKLNAISHPSTDSKSEGGVVYVGRIPHGFYEHEMRAYFSQFGDISRLRLSRNKTTGASKHYAFIEFDSEEVAKIVQDTMDGYLLFGHILKVKSLDPSQLHPKIWKGANRRFNKVPKAQIEGRKLAAPMSREQWEKRIEREQEKRKAKAEKMKEVFDYEYEGPPLKGIDQVPVKKTQKAIADESAAVDVVEEEKTLVTEPGAEGSSMMITESTITKKVRKPSAKAKAIEDSKEAAAAASKKGKRKAEGVLEKGKDLTEPVAKKTKNAKAKTEEVIKDATDAAAPALEKAKKTGEKAVKKAKDSLDDAADAAAPALEKAKKTGEKAVNKAKDSLDDAAPVAKKAKAKAEKGAKEAGENVSEAAETATGTTKKAKTAKA